MSIAYLFISSLKDGQALSLRLDEQGQIDQQLALRSLDDYRDMAKEAKSIIILPSNKASIHLIELPKLSDNKARAALPFALEESLAQPVDELHFAFKQMPKDAQQYCVIVLDKHYFAECYQTLLDNLVPITEITLDWSALKANESCQTPDYLLIQHPLINGAINTNLMKDTAEFQCEHQEKFENSEQACQFIAKRLFEQPCINLCQGEFQLKQQKNDYRSWYKTAAISALICLCSFILSKGVLLWQLNHKIKTIDTDITKSYQHFFPDAKQVINPRFRISALLSEQDNQSTQGLWPVLLKLESAFNSKQLTVSSLQWRQNRLSITLLSPNFKTLETLQNKLQNTGLKVAQTQATTKNEQVQATLELSL